jgi:hypothetical protein
MKSDISSTPLRSSGNNLPNGIKVSKVKKGSVKKIFLILGWLAVVTFLRIDPAQAQTQLQAAYVTFPETITICNEPVPLSNRSVWERMDREFLTNIYDQGQVYLWLKRSSRFFPFIEARLKEKGMPDDLKYLMVAESALRTRTISNKGAAGFWQFMEKTGKRFGLQKKPWVDERLDLAKSTDAAINYLKMLYDQFGKWTLAMASYNCGEDRVRDEIAQQGENDFFRLSLPQETERYIFRILTAKVILSDPQRYGFDFPAEDTYLPIETDTIVLQLPQSIPLRDIAKGCGSYVRELKELNPEIQGNTLPPGVYQLKIPAGNKSLAERQLKDYIKTTP